MEVVAFYLPQFHPIPENDEWWGPGFTEWRNVAAAKPLFRGHVQPKLPTELGFYDLRVPEVRARQAALARRAGVTSFCYWHYWFAGRRLLERPFAEVLESGEPDFGFCLGWANGSWTGIWHGAPDRVLIEQTYPGPDDYRRHLDALLPAFFDRRYTTVDGKPLLYIHQPTEIPDPRVMVDVWQDAAASAGLPGLFIVAQSRDGRWAIDRGFDAYVSMPSWREAAQGPGVAGTWKGRLLGRVRPPIRGPYEHLNEMLRTAAHQDDGRCFPCIAPGWDNTPRSGRRGIVLLDSSPERFGRQARDAVESLSARPDHRRLLFVKSWNEWAEGNYMEPDAEWGDERIRVLGEVLRDQPRRTPAGG